MKSNWIYIKLDEVIESVSDTYKFKTKDQDIDEIYFLNTSDVLDGKVTNHNKFNVKDLPGQAKKKFKEKDILYSEIRPINKRFAYIDYYSKNYIASTKLMVLRNKGNIDNKFLYNLLTHDMFLLKMQTLAESRSGTFPQITFDVLKNEEVCIPTSLIEQHNIANILSTIDAKIELNNKINEKLEATAKALYNEWFVNFNFPNEQGLPYKDKGGELYETELGDIPVGWDIKDLGDVTEKFTTGLNPRKNFILGHGNNYYVTIKNMNNKIIILDNKCDKIDDDALSIINKRSNLVKGDLLFSGIGTIGRVYYIDKTPENWNISESIFTLRSNKYLTSEILYQILLSQNLQNYAIQLASGSVQKGIRMGDLKRYKLLIPDRNFQNTLSKILINIINKQKNAEYENNCLSNLKNLLLNKLMTGQIDTNDLNINWDKLSKTLEEIE